MNVTVVQAELKDLDSLAPLLDAYRSFCGQKSDPDGAMAFLEDRLENQDSIILVARDGANAAIGFLQLYPSFTSLHMRRIWIVNDLYVNPTARRKGVARKLMESAREVASRTHAGGLEFAVGRENSEAKALYESLGCKPDAVFDHYHLSLQGGDGAPR